MCKCVIQTIPKNIYTSEGSSEDSGKVLVSLGTVAAWRLFLALRRRSNSSINLRLVDWKNRIITI